MSMIDQTTLLILEAKRGDSEASERLVKENSVLIWSVAWRFFGRGVEADDLYQLGCLGFLKAIEGYDESYGTRFSTYAVPKIGGEIRRFLRDDGSIKVSRSIKERANAIRHARERLNQQLGRSHFIRASRRDRLHAGGYSTAETATETPTRYSGKTARASHLKAHSGSMAWRTMLWRALR